MVWMATAVEAVNPVRHADVTAEVELLVDAPECSGDFRDYPLTNIVLMLSPPLPKRKDK
jgi:hypothetical protein